MLLMFKVKNYMSFKNETVLDLRASAYTQHPSHVIAVNDKVSLLKAAVLYGANASGKSNFVSAMYFFGQYIFSQFVEQPEKMQEKFSKRKPKLEPFALIENQNEASEFEIIFVINGKQIQYGFEATDKELLEEWLYISEKKVFERHRLELSFGSQYKKLLAPYQKIPAERLYISVLDYFLAEEARTLVLDDFISFFSQHFNVYSEILFESTVKGLAGSFGLSNRLVTDLDYRTKIEKYLALIDLGIKKLDVKSELVVDDNTGKSNEVLVIRTVHDVYDDVGNIAFEKTFQLFQESNGTLRFLAYIQNIVELIETGGVFIVDELSARLHPLITKLIVDIFCSSKNKKAQLIFTTHDLSLLNKDQFRRDEIYFVDKNKYGESSLYALSDLRVREDATFNKEYLQGKYGAIPVFQYDQIEKIQ